MERLRNATITAETSSLIRRNAPSRDSTLPARQTPAVSRQDCVELSEAWEEKASLNHSVSLLLEELKKKYPGISITPGAIDRTGLRQTAVQSGAGAHLIISQDFLDRMTGSEAAFNDCKTLLTEILNQLSDGQPFSQASGAWLEKDQVTFWSVPLKEEQYTKNDQILRLLEQFQKQNSTSSNNGKLRYSAASEDYNTAGKFNRLAGASSKMAVQTVMGDAQKSIVSLRLVSCLGDTETKQKARSAIRSLQKLLLRGRKKISRLQAEELLHARKRKAHAKQQEEKEREIKAEIRKREQKRRNADNLIRKEGKLDSYGSLWHQKQLHDREERLRQYEGSCFESLSAEMPADVSTGIIDAGMGAGGFSAAEVVISAPISL